MNDFVDINNWETLTQFFPLGWEEKAKELGALTRKRKFKSVSDLLRVLLIHLATNSSLVETVTKSKYGKLADVSDVAILKRLKTSASWFNWMSNQLLERKGVALLPPSDFTDYKVRTIDASVISEPGSTGTDWRLHYSMELFNLQCDEFMISSPQKGESMLNFTINPNDLMIGDRAYGNYKGMKYISDNRGFYLLRIKKDAFSVYDKHGIKINIIDHLRKLKIGETLDLKGYAGVANSEKLLVRIIALRNSEGVAAESIKRAKEEMQRKQQKIYELTLEYHKYIILVSNLPSNIEASRILELYRLRWQIELSFKRLKSIFGLGHLPKKDPQAARAWLQGKLFIAILTQIIIDESQFFSPWGYPLPSR